MIEKLKKKLNVFTENSDFLNLRFISNQHIEKKNLQMNHSSLFSIVFFFTKCFNAGETSNTIN